MRTWRPEKSENRDFHVCHFLLLDVFFFFLWWLLACRSADSAEYTPAFSAQVNDSASRSDVERAALPLSLPLSPSASEVRSSAVSARLGEEGFLTFQHPEIVPMIQAETGGASGDDRR